MRPGQRHGLGLVKEILNHAAVDVRPGKGMAWISIKIYINLPAVDQAARQQRHIELVLD